MLQTQKDSVGQHQSPATLLQTHFAVPSVEVRRFLAQPFVPREVWKGRSYEEEESDAYYGTLGLGTGLYDNEENRSARVLRDLFNTQTENAITHRAGRVP